MIFGTWKLPTRNHELHVNRSDLFGVIVSHPTSDVFRVVSSPQDGAFNTRQSRIVFQLHQVIKTR